MTTEELLDALRAAAAQGDEKARWMLRMLVTDYSPASASLEASRSQ